MKESQEIIVNCYFTCQGQAPGCAVFPPITNADFDNTRPHRAFPTGIEVDVGCGTKQEAVLN